MKYQQKVRIGGTGTGPHQFENAINGVSVDDENQLWVVGDSQVKRFDSDGKLVKSWETPQPGLSVDVEDQSVWVGQRGQLEVYDRDGRLLDSWKDTEKLGRVTALKRVEDHTLVADSLDRCIRRLDQDGHLLNNIGKDNRMKGFNIPNGCLDFDLDRNHILYACNPGKHRVERYTLEGELLGHIGRFDGINPEGFPGCCNPTNVAVDSIGQIYVTEKAGPRAKVYSPEGELVAVIASEVFDPACKNMDLAVDSEGNVFVVDTIRLLIYQFSPV